MKIKKYHISYLIILVIALLGIRCSKDLGNYDYKTINELEINNWQEEYATITDFDTLRIKPSFASNFNLQDTSRYEFRWVIKYDAFGNDTIGRYQHLNLYVKLSTGSYNLEYRIKDKETGITFIKKAKLLVSTPYTRGILMIGEDQNGETEAEMLSMISDTIHIKDLIKNSGIDGDVTGPVKIMYGGGYDDSHKLVWVLTEKGSYYLDRKTMRYTPYSTIANFLLPTDPIDVSKEYALDIAPQIKNAEGAVSDEFYKVVLTSSGNIYPTYTSLGAGYFLNPVNRTAANFDELLPAAPYLLYPLGSMNSMMWFDSKNKRFMNITGFLFVDYSSYPNDQPTDIFSWNLGAENKDLLYAENTFNTDGGFPNGNSFAVVKSADNTCNIYKFHARGSSPVKLGNYSVKPIAQNFDKAQQYAFSSTRTVVFYVYNGKLYAYDYNPGFERFYEIADFAGKEVTMIKFDTQHTPAQNSLYIATYDEQNGGTLERFVLDNNPNTIQLLPVPNSRWDGLLKIKNISWKSERY